MIINNKKEMATPSLFLPYFENKKHRIDAVSFFKLVAPAGFEPATF